MAAPFSMASTPEGYATPDQIAQAQQLSSLLMKGGQRDQQITSPWQGARMMADSLAGQMQARHAGQQEMASRAYDNPQSLAGPYSGPPTMHGRNYIPQQTPGDTSIDPQTSTQPGAYGGLPPPVVDSIRKQEGFAPKAQWDVKQNTYGYGSKAPYAGATISRSGAEELLNRDLSQAAGMVDQVNPKLDPGTRSALADLTMNTGIGWSKAGLGDAVRAGDPNAIKQHLLQYNQVAGKPNQVIANRRQMDAGWIGSPGAQVAQAGPVPQGGAQMAANVHSPGITGTPASQPPPVGKAPIANAPPGAATPADQNPPPASLYQGRPSISKEDFNRAMISPWIPEERKSKLMDMYLQQNQPLNFQTPTGTWVRGADGQQQFVPGVMSGEVESGGSKFKGPLGQGTPGGGMQPMPGLGGVLGGGGGASVQQPSSNIQQQPAGQGQPISGPSLEMPPVGGAPPPPPGPGPQGTNIPLRPGTQTAMLQPPQGGQPGLPLQAPPRPAPPTPPQPASPQQGRPQPGAAPQGAPPPVPPGMLGQGPPTPGMLSATPPQPNRMAQAGPQGVGGLMGQLQQMDLEQERRKKFIESDQKSYGELNDTVNMSGRNAAALIPQLNVADAALKKIYTGIGAYQINNLQRLKAALGGNPEAASAFQVFQKATSEAIAEGLKQFQGLGQIRNKEIELKEKASAGIYNTPQANEVVLGVAKASAQQAQGMADIANRYGQGQRYQNGKWYQTQETPTNAGLQQLLLKYAQSHPIMNDEQIDKAMNTLKADSWKEHDPGLPPGVEVDPVR